MTDPGAMFTEVLYTDRVELGAHPIKANFCGIWLVSRRAHQLVILLEVDVDDLVGSARPRYIDGETSQVAKAVVKFRFFLQK